MRLGLRSDKYDTISKCANDSGETWFPREDVTFYVDRRVLPVRAFSFHNIVSPIFVFSLDSRIASVRAQFIILINDKPLLLVKIMRPERKLLSILSYKTFQGRGNTRTTLRRLTLRTRATLEEQQVEGVVEAK